MISDDVLALAVERRVIAPAQADALRDLARQSARDRFDPVDDEKLRFISGFADIFVTIGLALFLSSAAYLLHNALPPVGVNACTAILAWLLAEFFTRRRRMALPSIALLLVFAGSSFGMLVLLAGGKAGGALPSSWLTPLWNPSDSTLPLALAALGTVALTGLHYWRFRVPVTVAAGAGALALCVVLVMLALSPDLTRRALNGLLFTIGLAVFGAAMWFDFRDPRRETRRTDIAFWLHMLASPLIVHSVFQSLGAGRGTIDSQTSAVVLVVFAVLALIAVLVDRRALLVSGLVYAGVAFGSLLSKAGFTSQTVPFTLLVLGALVLLLSAGWTPLRNALLGLMPRPVAAKLPHSALS